MRKASIAMSWWRSANECGARERLLWFPFDCDVINECKDCVSHTVWDFWLWLICMRFGPNFPAVDHCWYAWACNVYLFEFFVLGTYVVSLWHLAFKCLTHALAFMRSLRLNGWRSGMMSFWFGCEWSGFDFVAIFVLRLTPHSSSRR